MEAKILGRDTKKSFVGKVQNASTYDFKDSETDLPADPSNIPDKNDLTQYNSRIKQSSDEDLEWDSIVVENLPDTDLELIKKAILDSYSKPDFSWDKDPGQGRAIQKIDVKGERPVYYDLHKDEHGNHLHLKVFRYSVDKQSGKTAFAPNEVPKVADAQFIYTNEVLKERGLPQLGQINKSFSNQANKPTEETKVQVKDIISQEKTIEQVITKIEATNTFDEKTLDLALSADEKELARLLQLAKVKAEEIESKKQAKTIVEENRKLQFLLQEKDKEVIATKEEYAKLETVANTRNDYLNGVIQVMGITPVELQEQNKTVPEFVKDKLEEKDNDYNNLQEEFDDYKAETTKYIEAITEQAKKELAETISKKDIERVNEVNAVKADFIDKLSAKDVLIGEKEVEIKEKKIETGKVKIELENTKKVKESLEIQVAEGHKKNADLLNKNTSLQAEIEKLKADNLKQMEEFKKQKEEADKKLDEEKVKTAKLEKENAEKDLKFREFASNFVNEVKGKLNNLSASISKLARGIKDPAQKKEANEISKDIKGSLSDFTKKFGSVDKKEDNNNNSQNKTNNPHKKF